MQSHRDTLEVILELFCDHGSSVVSNLLLARTMQSTSRVPLRDDVYLWAFYNV